MDPDFRSRFTGTKSYGASTNTVNEAEKDKTNNFRTPEEVAAEQTPQSAYAFTAPAGVSTPADNSDEKWWRRFKLQWPPGQREWLASLIIIVVCGSIVGFVLAHIGSKPVAKADPVHSVAKVPPKPKTVPSALSGLPVDPSLNQRPVTGVMIENSLDARPQAALGQASVVFEAIAEGGITRFLALFQDTAPENVGPIRSARPYYVQWALGFDAGYAHVGGSPAALAAIRDWGVRDLDQFHNGGSYHRISQRAAPHNVYTGVPTLIQLEASKGYTSSKFTSLQRKPAEKALKTPTARTIDFRISGPTYNAHFDYNAATNSYNRSEGGAPHIDANTNTQISPKVVIALVMPYALEPDGYHSAYSTIGSGPVYIFQDGGISTGQWAKASAASQFVFTDAAGKPLKLNPGQTWLTALADTGRVTYAP